MINEITSAKNPRIKHIKSLAQKKFRTLCGEYIVEGEKSVQEAIDSNEEIVTILKRDDCEIPLGWENKFTVYSVPESIYDTISDTKSPQGIMAVIRTHDKGVLELKENGKYIYCDSVNDPGNLGTIIRTADSVGFDGVLLSPECVDVYSPKAVRATMGSLFHINVQSSVTVSDLAQLTEFKIYGGILSGETRDYREVDYHGGVIIVVGNEAGGICEEVKKICTPIKIPIYGKAESLNVGIAAALMMYKVKELTENEQN